MPRRALLLINRHSRRGRQGISQAVELLQAAGLELWEEPARHSHHLADIILAYRDRCDLVIIGGGDGTLNAALPGLVETGLPLGILPLGTANDLARSLGIPNTLADACRVITTGHQRSIDLGWVNGRYFLNVASLGLSCAITERLTHEVKQRWGVLAYAATAIQVIWQTRPFRAEISWNGQTLAVRTVQIAVGNGRFYGGGLPIAHDAVLDDQRLDLYSLEIDHWWKIFPLLPAMSRGRQGNWPEVRCIQTDEVEIRTRRPYPINTDGELTTYTPARFRVLPQILPVFVPPEVDAPGLSG
uniref:Diacylglycerol kinase catalytic region n=1 Tax=Cyanothece sp. (strain PCC 7425 / ATCC 29141) TaxID=395961 RepID=B8HTJ7_CYAP4